MSFQGTVSSAIPCPPQGHPPTCCHSGGRSPAGPAHPREGSLGASPAALAQPHCPRPRRPGGSPQLGAAGVSRVDTEPPPSSPSSQLGESKQRAQPRLPATHVASAPPSTPRPPGFSLSCPKIGVSERRGCGPSPDSTLGCPQVLRRGRYTCAGRRQAPRHLRQVRWVKRAPFSCKSQSADSTRSQKQRFSMGLSRTIVREVSRTPPEAQQQAGPGW